MLPLLQQAEMPDRRENQAGTFIQEKIKLVSGVLETLRAARAQGHWVVVPPLQPPGHPQQRFLTLCGGGFAFVLPVAGAMGYLGEQPRAAHL